MKNSLFCLCFLASASLNAVVTAAPIDLTPERANHAASLMSDGRLLITGGVNEGATLDSALTYDPSGPRKLKVTGTMTGVRSNHTSTTLPDGTVLLTGGELSDGTTLKSSELYDPVAGTFTAVTKAMTIPRSKHTATLLPNGKVLLVGGKQADLYDPATKTYTQTTGTQPTNRKSHATLLLPNGTVLITGGYVGKLAATSAEIYDPATQNFTQTLHPMVIPRANHAMTLMADGRVLVTGGYSGTSPHDEVDIYDPATQTFTATTPMLYHRSNHRTVLLPDGRVLAIGGTTLESGFMFINEAFDPTANPPTWTPHDVMVQNRSGHTATTMGDGTIFVAGGVTGSTTLQSAEVVDPTTHLFSLVGNMNSGRNQHTDNLLADGTVLLAAGSTDAAALKSAEVFNPTTNIFTPVGSLSEARKSHTATRLQDGRVLVAGGKTADRDTRSAEIYDPTTQQFHGIAPMKVRRSLFTATLLNDGRVLMAAGRHGGTPTPLAELFNPVTENFTATTGTLNLQRKRHRASLLPDGTVLISGGAALSNDQQPNSGTPTCEIYDPATDLFTWHPPVDMSVGRTEHQSTLLPDGTVLVSGGLTLPNNADIYQAGTKSFSPGGELNQERYRHEAVLLSNPAWGSLQGQVLILGGATVSTSIFGGIAQALNSVEIYNPATGVFSLFDNPMQVARQNFTATLLNDGRILCAGGVSRPFVSNTAEIVSP